jgi:hypothetical protein
VASFFSIFFSGRLFPGLEAGSNDLHASSNLPYGLSAGGRSGVLFAASARGNSDGN